MSARVSLIGSGLVIVVLWVALAVDSSAAGELRATLMYRATPHDALFDIHMDARTAIAVGAHGVILTSSDGVKRWQSVSSGTSLALLAVTVSDEKHALIVGQGGVTLRSGDGGRSWSNVAHGITERLFSVAMETDGFAIAVGAFGTIAMSRDHGRTWERAAPNWAALLSDVDPPHLYSVLRVDANRFVVVGEFSVVLEFRRDSQNWILLHRGEASLFALARSHDGGLWAAGQDGHVLRSDSRGRDWTALDAGVRTEWLDIHIGANGDGLLVGRSVLYLTADSGQSWQRGPRSPLPWQQALALTPSGDYLVVGAAGGIVHLSARE